MPGQGGYYLIAGAAISVLEIPELSTTSDDEGKFTVERVPVGSQATFVLEHRRYPLTYTKTHTIPETDIDDLTFQVPNSGLYIVIETGLGITSDPDQMAAFVAEYPPETYPDDDLRCQTEDVQFESVLMKCRPGVFLNASPSYGLQAQPAE